MGPTQTIGTVPAGETWIIKYIALQDTLGLAHAVFGVHANDNVTEVNLDVIEGNAEGFGQDKDIFAVVEQGVVLRIGRAAAANQTQYFLSGARLFGIAP